MEHHWIVPIDGLISDLLNLPEDCGVCIDVSIHSTNRVLFLEKSALDLDTFLHAWAKCLETTAELPYKRTLAIRVQSRGVETPCLELLEKHGIKDYFFVESSFLDVFDIRTQNPDCAKFAYRYSEYEGIEDLLRNPELYDWLFIDSLTGQTLLTRELYEWAGRKGIRICVQSPILHGLPYNHAFFQNLEQYNQITVLSPLM